MPAHAGGLLRQLPQAGTQQFSNSWIHGPKDHCDESCREKTELWVAEAVREDSREEEALKGWKKVQEWSQGGQARSRTLEQRQQAGKGRAFQGPEVAHFGWGGSGDSGKMAELGI